MKKYLLTLAAIMLATTALAMPRGIVRLDAQTVKKLLLKRQMPRPGKISAKANFQILCSPIYLSSTLTIQLTCNIRKASRLPGSTA